MSDHFHLLIRKREESVEETVKGIASSYLYYFIRKYRLDGHLFKERFKSGPVNDMAYFTVLLRYIHHNPVKAGTVQRVKDSEYISWGYFEETIEPLFQICDTGIMLNRIPFRDLEEWKNEPLDDEVQCLDNDKDRPRLRLSEAQVWREIIKIASVSNSSSFQQLDKNNNESRCASERKAMLA
jgi:hypothetical protein